MRTVPTLRLLSVLAVGISLVSLTGPMSGNFHLPSVQLVHAIPQKCDFPTSGGCSEYWLPAGPAEDTFVATIFTNEAAEFTDIQSTTPHIDFTDSPLTPDLIQPFTSSNNLEITSTISADVNFEIQFMLANNFWGINFNFGNDPNGVQIRQGIAHMIDTALYAANEPSCSGQCFALDTPNPPDNVGSLPTANPCAWDTLFPQSGPNCKVGAPGGTAYHLASATGSNGLSYFYAPGSSDLNAAAAHFVAAGVATGCDGATGVASCVSSTDSRLSGISAAAAAHTVSFFIRNDSPPRLHLGDAYAAQICYIFTGSYTAPCLPYLNTTHGPITAFPGFTTSTTSVRLSWGMYTAQFGSVSGVLPFDSNYYSTYNSLFASGMTSIQPPNGPCSAQAVPTVSAADYMYLCNQQYDSLTSQMEFAPCFSAPGDISAGQNSTQETLSTCPGQATPTFAITSGSTIVMAQNRSASVPTSVTGLNGFTGTVNLLATVSPTVTNGPTASLSSNTQTVSGGTPVEGGLGPNLVVTTGLLTPVGFYDVILTGTSGSTLSSADVVVQVTATTNGHLPLGSGFGYTLPGGSAHSHYDHAALGLNATSVIAATSVTSVIPECPGSRTTTEGSIGWCSVGPSGSFGEKITYAASAGGLNVPSTLVICATTCSFTAGGTTYSFAQTSFVLVGGVGPSGVGLTACGGFACPKEPYSTYVAATGTASAFSAGVLAADNFGAAAYTIEMFTQTSQFGYLNNGWIRVDNSVGSGLPGFWTWLNAWNPSPVAPGTIRQGYKSTTTSISPFIDSTLWDRLTVGEIYDSLGVTNPLNGGQFIDYMAESMQQLPNSALLYTPPPNTTQTFRYFLRGDMFFQDGRKLTTFDVAFSYLALKGTGAFVGGGAAPMTGITILGPSEIDINVNASGPFTVLSLSGLPIMPGAYWSSAGNSAFTSGVGSCSATGAACYPAQYTINAATPTTTSCNMAAGFSCTFGPNLMNVNVAQTSASYDPITAHTLIGSGAFECGAVTSSGSGSCSSSGTMNPPVGGSYTLQRFGKGLDPASSVSSIYFRSNGNLALYLWSQNNGDTQHDFLNFSVVSACAGVALTSTGPCAHFQQGMGAGTGGPIPVGLGQFSIVARFRLLNWIAPFLWATTPPLGILPFANQVLYENNITLNPASLVGCTTPYPVGGYDC